MRIITPEPCHAQGYYNVIPASPAGKPASGTREAILSSCRNQSQPPFEHSARNLPHLCACEAGRRRPYLKPVAATAPRASIAALRQSASSCLRQSRAAITVRVPVVICAFSQRGLGLPFIQFSGSVGMAAEMVFRRRLLQAGIPASSIARHLTLSSGMGGESLNVNAGSEQ